MGTAPINRCSSVEHQLLSVAPARGARGAVAPHVKKMALVILPNSMRKLGEWVVLQQIYLS